MKKYDHTKIEKKWQKDWDTKKIYQVKNGTKVLSKRKKFYGLIEFPYPSGAGLHVGHIRSNTAMDIITRKRRMEGYNVLFPIGWDAFGLPTENYAIKTGIQPEKVTKQNTDTFRKQLKEIGFGFDWSREVNTTDPTYYKWTQWIFLQLYKKGLAYKAKSIINWCPKDKIGLANEEVVNGCCERCDTPVVKREKEQWMLAITKYADRLDADLDTVDYLPKIKTQQRNWIGKSEGSEIDFLIKNSKESIKIFTTRADTIYGATYMVFAPEHPWVTRNLDIFENKDEVKAYIQKTKEKDEIERTTDDKEKTGVELKGIKALNPASGEEIPLFIGDHVLLQYGTGAIMAVPAHDERDFEFAKKYHVGSKSVVQGVPILNTKDSFYTGEGILTDSGEFSGMNSEEARIKITEAIGGKMVTKYKLRDWVFSRQRYWGEPIPIIHCATCGYVPVPEKDLPVTLPKVKSYVPTDTGESPLAIIDKWVNVKCPICKGKATRETDTMPNWAGSSWYYLRYADPKNQKEFASKKNLKYWTPVDWYNGGMEHTTLHLLYSRFWHKFLYDLKLVPTSEPYTKRTSHGMILAEGGVKMSKSIGNTVDPKDIVKTYGADTLRIYEMFMGPFDQAVAWNTQSIIGSRRFLEKVWKSLEYVDAMTSTQKVSSTKLKTILHKTIKKVTEDIESMSFNTAISSTMVLVNEIEKVKTISKKDFKFFLQILAPFAPHITEELWRGLDEKKSIHLSAWPKWDPEKIITDVLKIIIQVNGKVRAEMMVHRDIDEEDVKKCALENKAIIGWTVGKDIKRFIYIKDRLVNIVV